MLHFGIIALTADGGMGIMATYYRNTGQFAVFTTTRSFFLYLKANRRYSLGRCGLKGVVTGGVASGGVED